MFEIDEEKKGVEKKFWDLSRQIVQEDLGLKIYYLDYVPGQKLLKVFIHQEEKLTASIEDCVKVDKAFDSYLERVDFIPEGFKLEVSSPGVYREIKNKQHFEMSKNEIVKIKISGEIRVFEENSVDSKSENHSFKGLLRGALKDVNDDGVFIEEEKKRQLYFIPFTSIKNAHLDPNWEDLIASSEVNV